jgi:cell division protein FtsX
LTERRYVVLDLFVFHAIAGDDVDLLSKTVAALQLIKDKCHTILLTRELKNEYWKRAREIEKDKSKIHVDIRLLKFVKNLLVDKDKVEEVEYLPGEQELEFLRRVVPEKDLPIVRAALSKPATNIVIITTDKRHLVDNEALKAYLKRVNPGIEVIHLDEYVKLDP